MKTFDCPCGAHLEADADDDLLAVAKEHAAAEHAEDPAYSDMELEAAVERSAQEEAEQ